MCEPAIRGTTKQRFVPENQYSALVHLFICLDTKPLESIPVYDLSYIRMHYPQPIFTYYP